MASLRVSATPSNSEDKRAESEPDEEERTRMSVFCVVHRGEFPFDPPIRKHDSSSLQRLFRPNTVREMQMRDLLSLLVLLAPILAGCASIAKGVTEGVMASREQGDAPTSICTIRGPAFEALASTLERQSHAGPGHSTKVLMVHGIGKHLPGYSGRLRDNLASALGPNVVQEKFKELSLLGPPPRPDLDLAMRCSGRCVSTGIPTRRHPGSCCSTSSRGPGSPIH